MLWAVSDVPLDVPELVERLERVYGPPEPVRMSDPLDELVSCILSQHTSDATSIPAFRRLKETYPCWQQVVEAGPEGVEETIRAAGLAKQKARSILACLVRIREMVGEYSLDHLRELPMREGRRMLESLPGVGPKTASIVLCFSLGMPAIPVDTHVHRVTRRLGLIPDRMSADKAHDRLLELCPPELAYRFHVDLIRHGRLTCKAPKPRCGECAVSGMCAFLRGQA